MDATWILWAAPAGLCLDLVGVLCLAYEVWLAHLETVRVNDWLQAANERDLEGNEARARFVIDEARTIAAGHRPSFRHPLNAQDERTAAEAPKAARRFREVAYFVSGNFLRWRSRWFRVGVGLLVGGFLLQIIAAVGNLTVLQSA